MKKSHSSQWIVSILALATFLRFYKLDTQLWLDEISALLGSYRHPFWEILMKFPGYFPHPLYDQLAHGSLRLLGESAFAIRLPAAIFGVASIVAFYRLARRVSGEGEALLGTALLAVSYHHVYFSQNARGYTLYLFFAIVATELLLRLLQRMEWRTALAYAGIAALAAYSQTAGLTLAAGQIAVAFAAIFFFPKGNDSPAPRHLAGTLGITLALTLVLYAPLIADSLGYTAVAAAEAPPVGRSARLLDLATELLRGLVPAFAHWAVLAGAVAICAVGAWDYFRRNAIVLAALIVPVVISLIAMALLGGALHSRYFLLILVAGYLVGARGIVLIARASVKHFHLPGWAPPALGVILVMLAATPLLSYYSMPKQDFLGALQYVRSAAGPGDRAVAADLAAHAYQSYYAPEFPAIEDLPDLLREEATGHAVWVIATFERIEAKRRPELLARLQNEYQLAKVLPASTQDGEMRIYFRPAKTSRPL